MIRTAGLALVASCFLSGYVRAAELIAGPMIGHVTASSARVWMQFSEAGEVTITVYPVGSTQPVSGVRVGIEGPSPFICDIPLQNLSADRTYRIEAKYDGQLVRLPPFTIRTAPVPGDEATFSVAFGSNLGVSPLGPEVPGSPAPRAVSPVLPLPIFRAIEETKPRAFFFLGNTGRLPDAIGDFPTTRRAAFRYITDFHSAIRRMPALQPLFTSTPCYALYNDHDFGPTGATGAYPFAGESLVAFQKFWPNPDWGTPQDPGCFTSFSLGDIDFFLLDTRTFREAAPPSTTPATSARPPVLLGEPQLAWLRKGLKESRASFKILAAPCTLWGDAPARPDADSWSNFPAEQKEFIDWLGAQRMNGIVALAGNHAAGEITKVKVDALAYPLYTIASSALCLPEGARFAAPAENPNRAVAPISECTFGTLDFGGDREHRFITLRLRDEKGKSRAEQTLFAAQLKN